MDPTPEELAAVAPLIRRAREAQGISPQKAVQRLARISMSVKHWYNIESGARKTSYSTLAHMAHAVELSPDRLAEAATEAAEILREIQRQESAGEVAEPRPEEMTRAELIAEARKMTAQALELNARADEYLRRAQDETG